VTQAVSLPADTSRRRGIGLHVGVLAGFTLLSLLMWWHVWVTGHPTASITCRCGDPVEELWWLEWLPWAIVHGHSPFFSSVLYAGSGGVNELANGSQMFPALVLSPVTLLFGPVAAFNVGALLGPVVSAWCMFLLARKVTTFVPGQVFAALLWGFSPFVVYNLPHGHLLHVLGVFEPLAALVVYDVLFEHRRPPWLDGLALGALIVLEFFTSSEMLAVTGMIGAAGAIAATCLARRHVWALRRPIAVTALTALAASVVVLVYPVWFALAGPRHFSGQPWPFNSVGQSPRTLVSVGPHIHQVGPILRAIGYSNPVPNPGYLGWGLLALIAVSAPLWRNRTLAWCALISGAVAWALSWGVPAGDTHWWPWRLFDRLPVVSDIQPTRFADIVVFCVALLLALSLDGWWKWITNRVARAQQHRASQWSASSLRAFLAAVVILVTVGAIAPIGATYTLPFAVSATGTPGSQWFVQKAPHLPAGTRVLALPFPSVLSYDASMAYQARDSFRFDLAGGYELVPGTGGRSNFARPPGGTSAVLVALTWGPFGGYPEPSTTARNLAMMRSSLRRWGINVVVLTPYENMNAALSFMTAVYGRPPVKQDGAWAWYGGP
jgi:hypothetical protein